MIRCLVLFAVLAPSACLADHCFVRKQVVVQKHIVAVPAITYIPYVYPAVGYGHVQQASHLTEDEKLDAIAERLAARMESRLQLPQLAAASKFGKCYQCHGPQSNKADARAAFSLQNDPPSAEEAAEMQHGVLEAGMAERAGFQPADVLEFLKQTSGIIRAKPAEVLP